MLAVLMLKLISEILTREFELGPCFLQFLEPCANNSIQFFLFSSNNPRDPPVLLNNISPMLPLDYNETAEVNFKLIIHGYGGHLDFNGSKQIRNGKDFVSVPMEKTWLLTLNKPAFIAKLCETHIRRL